MEEKSWVSALECIRIESKALAMVADYTHKESFSRAVDILASCGKTITCASGTSGIAAKKFAHSLCCIERDALFLSPAEAVHGGLGCVKKEDAMILVSRGGKTAELMPIIDVCRKKGAKVIVLTEQPDSPLGRLADLVLFFTVEREGDPLDVMATASFIATIALFDALLSALICETGYTLAQFGLIHPGGAVGERLNP